MEKFKKLISSLNQYVKFSEEEVSQIVGMLKVETFQKDHFLLKEGEICRRLSFVNTGSFRKYHTTTDDAEIITDLYLPQDWILDHQSFTSQSPSHQYIAAAEESEVFHLTLHTIHYLIEESPSFFRLGKLLAFETSDENKKRTLSPEEQYQQILTERPQLLQKFPLKHIASFLNITPETLSRIRAKVS